MRLYQAFRDFTSILIAGVWQRLCALTEVTVTYCSHPAFKVGTDHFLGYSMAHSERGIDYDSGSKFV